jgi:3-oxoacyl-[acyl-carrier-protein] synthase-1
MSTPLAAVIGAGVCCSLGLDLESSLAAVEAGMSRMVETVPGSDDPAVVAALELLALDTARGRRIHWLAGAAYLDLVRRFPDWKKVDLPLIIVGPERHADHDVPRDFMITHLRELSEVAIPRPVPQFWWSGGRGGWFAALEHAIALLHGGAPLILLGAVDSDCDPNSLRRLVRRNALLGKRNPGGRIPGEAAVFVMLARPDVPRQIRARPWAWIRACSTASEPRHFMQPRSTLGEGLTALFGRLRETHVGWRADVVYSCQPSENFWGREFIMAYLRNPELIPEPLRFEKLCQELGDCGAASPALQLAFAGHRCSRGDALARALIYGESDDGALGACLLEAGEPIADARAEVSR